MESSMSISRKSFSQRHLIDCNLQNLQATRFHGIFSRIWAPKLILLCLVLLERPESMVARIFSRIWGHNRKFHVFYWKTRIDGIFVTPKYFVKFLWNSLRLAIASQRLVSRKIWQNTSKIFSTLLHCTY